MTNTRLQKLRDMIRQQPDDIFLKYALAMEFLGMQETDQAIGLFNDVLQADPDHVAAYYQLGKIFEARGEDNAAISCFEKGLEAAKMKNDQRAIREMKAALDELTC
jgi:lipopolysaccharide biosynthesis regulator YciM